jgi:hypothetical protein
MSEAGAARLSRAQGLPALAGAATRRLLGVAVGGGLGAVAWLIIMQDGFQRGFFGRRWSDQNFASAMGKLFGAGEADNIRQRGFYVTLVFAALVIALYGLVARLPWRWEYHALGVAGVAFLLWGVVFSPIVSAREATENGGLFGSSAGATAWIVAALASLAFAFVAVRIYRLMRDAEWWSAGRRRIEASQTLEAMGVADAQADALSSLELADERRERPALSSFELAEERREEP